MSSFYELYGPLIPFVVMFIVHIQLSLSLFMLAVGGHPFQTSLETDASFKLIVGGGAMKLLKRWKMNHYVSKEMVECIQSTLRYEIDRVDLEEMKQSEWLKVEE